MTATWTEVELGDILAFSSGKSIVPGGTGAYPAFGSNGLIGNSEKSLFASGIIIGRVGAYCGSTSLSRSPFWASDNTIVARPKDDDIDLDFAYFLLVQAKLNRWAGGAAQPLLTQAVLKPLRFRIPPGPTQRRIASILGAYDDLIEVNRRRIVILEEMARGLFEEWFVRFRFTGHKDCPMIEAPDGPLPAGWRHGTVADVFSLGRGRSYRSIDLAESGGRPFVNLKCIDRDGGFRLSGLKRYLGPFKSDQLVITGEMVMAVTDMTQERRIVGQVARIPQLEENEAVISMDLVKILPHPGVDPLFLYHWLRYSPFASIAAQRANGANVLHLSPASVQGIPIARPPEHLQLAFGHFVMPFLLSGDALLRTEQRLATSRDLLLPRLVSGELSVAQAERELEAAA